MKISLWLSCFLLMTGCCYLPLLTLAQKKEKAPDWHQSAYWLTAFERSKGTQTAEYHECINYYQELAKFYPQVKISEAGPTDSGSPMHVVVISEDGKANPEPELTRSKRVLFIQNGIHPGEPEGIDASMMLARDLVRDKKLQPLLKNITVVIVPVYNVDGALNRNSTSRANQNGPDSYGFRGNARNLDLNRDYIKLDSRNAQTLVQLFRKWQPDVFVDTHTSNGADYQHVITLVATQPDKLQPVLGNYLRSKMLPELYREMNRKKWPLTPYVDTKGPTPDTGIMGFGDHPRYSTGYAALFNCIGFMTETHMLKPFDKRVQATYAFLETLLQHMQKSHAEIGAARNEAITKTIAQKSFQINYQVDTSRSEQITFLGYEARYKKSEVSDQNRLYYDRSKPYKKQIPYYNYFTPGLSKQAPAAYLIPHAYSQVIDRLRMNGVELKPVTATAANVQALYIDSYETVKQPYEGHYLHSQVKTRPEMQMHSIGADFYAVVLNQPANRFIVEVLEPQAVDSYFNWNFFDSILQQKEWFSDYVFEDIAADLLKKSPILEQLLERKKAEDPAFAKNAWAQLYFIYQNSEYFEKSYKRYPVFRYDGDLQNLGIGPVGK